MRHIVYCWELGAGFGHVARMRQICADLGTENFRFSFIVKDLEKAGQYLNEFSREFHQAPVAPPYAKQQASPNYSHVMLRCGWDDETTAVTIVKNWTELLSELNPDIVLLDHAPTAAFCAAHLDVPFFHFGNGFEIPQLGNPMPTLSPWKEGPTKERKRCDEKLFERFKKVGRTVFSSGKKVRTLKDLFSFDNSLIVSEKYADHYGKRHNSWQYFIPEKLPLTPDTCRFNSPAADKPFVFFYLSAATNNIVNMLQEASKVFHIQGHFKELDARTKTLAKAANIHLYDKMVDLEQVFTKCDLVLSHCGHGLVSKCLSNNVPLAVLPAQLEQRMLAYELSQKGLLAVVPGNSDPHHFSVFLQRVVQHRQHIKNAQIKVNSKQTDDQIWRSRIEDFIDK